MPLPDQQPIVARPSMRDQVYEQLLTWIMEGVCLPGEKLVDTELAQNLGVSRTPVREALKRLEDKGLVESAANRWTRVAEIPDDEPGNIYPVIRALESLALSAAADRLTPADLGMMARANDQLKAALDNSDPVAATQADARFHQVFIHRSDNPHLITILEDLKIKCRRLEIVFFKEYTRNDTSVAEHDNIIAALTAKDVDLACRHLQHNWDSTLARHKARKGQ